MPASILGVEAYHRNIVRLQFAKKFLNPDGHITKSITIRRIYRTESEKNAHVLFRNSRIWFSAIDSTTWSL